MFTLHFMAMHTHKMTLCNKQTREKNIARTKKHRSPTLT